jgi:hypothetical protein
MFHALNERHAAEILWWEACFAIHPHLVAEMNRDKKRRRKPFELRDFTLTGLAADMKATPTDAPKDQSGLRSRIDRAMSRFGGKRGSDNR